MSTPHPYLADDSTLERAAPLVNPAKWRILGFFEEQIWGECQSSGAAPYRVSVAMQSFQNSCNCPSRLRPCKHCVALLLLFLANNALFETSEQPDWAAALFLKWQTKETSKPAMEQLPVQSAETDWTKPSEKRLYNIQDGFLRFNIWLEDNLSMGLAELLNKPISYWQEAARLLTDAQAGAVAEKVRITAKHLAPNKPEKLLNSIGHLAFLADFWLSTSPTELETAYDLWAAIGISFKKEQVLEKNFCTDNWLFCGYVLDDAPETMQLKRSWFYGAKTQKYACFLDFKHNSESFELEPTPIGTVMQANAHFYPSAYPLRALFSTITDTSKAYDLALWQGFLSFEELLGAFAKAFVLQPFLSCLPALMRNVCLLKNGFSYLLVDKEQLIIPLSDRFKASYELWVHGGEQPCHIFGEWNGQEFLPIGVVEDNFCLPLKKASELRNLPF